MPFAVRCSPLMLLAFAALERGALAQAPHQSAAGNRSGGEDAPSDAVLAGPVDRATLVRAAVARSPAVRASRERAAAMRSGARAEGSLPPPELMAEVWQVPFARPANFNAQMIMIGVAQQFPAPGALAAKADAMSARAAGESAMAFEGVRLTAREMSHAYADYVESTARHGIHRAHLDVAQRLAALASARHAAGGSLVDASKAEVELSRVEADVVTDAVLVRSARARINVLLGRDPDASLGAPTGTAARVPTVDAPRLLAKARELRPHLRAAEAERIARTHALRAAEREATWPSFGLGALYFPPTQMTREHGYGASLSISVPWLWGGAADRRRGEQQALRAATSERDAQQLPIDAEVVTAFNSAHSNGARLGVLQRRTWPASRGAFDVARAGYESGRVDLMTVLDARRSVVDVEHDIVVAQSSLDHALADLDAAVGVEVPTAPVEAGALTAPAQGVGHGD